MSNGFNAPNTVQVPYELFMKLPGMMESELKIILVVIQQEFGYGNPDKPLSFSELETRTGLTRPGVNNGVHAALKDGYIERVKVGNSYSYRLKVTAQQMVNEVNRNGKPSLLTTTTSISKYWIEEGGSALTPRLLDELEVMVEEYGRKEVEDAITEANRTVGAGQFAVKYVDGILKRWKREGRNAKKPVEDINPYAHRTVIR